MIRHAFTVALILGVVGSSHAAEQQTPLNEIYLEVSALSALYDLEATPAQVKALGDLAAETVSKKPLGESPHPGRPYRSALTALRDAYVKNDDNEIGDCQDRLAALEEKMDNPPDPRVEVTDAARRKVKDAIKLFTPAQITGYVSARSEDAPDPAGELVDAIDSVRGEAEKAFKRNRDELADEIASDVAGSEGRSHKSLHDDVVTFLEKVRAMSDEEVKSKHADLEAEARKIADVSDPLAVVTHWVQRDVAELLSNPRLPAALAARSK